MTSINQLHSDIDDRVTAIIEDNLEWPCRKGCDGCCRRLAEIPQLTIAEWDLLREGLSLLTPELLNQETGKFLHRFSWLEDSDIGSLPHEYNWLVGWYKEPRDGHPKILHYTEGGPWFENYRNCEYSDVWKKELINLFSS